MVFIVNSRGWGIKLIDKTLFNKVQKVENNINIESSLLSSVVRNLLPRESFIENLPTSEQMDKSDEFLYKYYVNSLSRYIYISTYKTKVFITSFDEDLKQINLGNFSPIDNYLRLKFSDVDNMGLNNMMSIRYYIEYSRYEYIMVSNALNKLVLGNKQGDISVYNLEITEKENGLVFNENPLAIIEVNTRVAGIRIHDVIDEYDYSKNLFYLYIVTIEGRFECYKFSNFN
jgi:hypothetical protein